MCSPRRSRVLYRFHSSGRWFFGSHWPNSSRNEKTRSFARAFSSSRRAPPMAASNESSAIASSRVTDCAAFLLSSKRRSLTVPRRIESSTERTMSRSWSSPARMSRKAITSGKLCPVSICISGNGNFAGRKAFSARRSSTMESLPPEKNSTGFAHSPATSRRMKTASDSSQSRWLRTGRARRAAFAGPRSCFARGGGAHETTVGSNVQPAFARFPDLPPPAPGANVFARDGGAGAGRAADGTVALVVQRVVGHLEGADVFPYLALAPVGKWIDLDDTPRGIVFLQLELGTRDGLLAALAGDPGFLAFERALERLDLADMAAALAQLLAFVEGIAAEIRDVFGNGAGIRPEHLHVVAVARADRADHVERIGVQPLRVEGEDFDFELVPQDGVGDHHVLGGEARGEGGRSVLERNAHQHALELGNLVLQRFGHVLPAPRRRRKSGTGRSTVAW